MSRNVIEIVINADNNASSVIQGVSSTLGTMGQNITRAGIGLTAMMAPIGILGAGGLKAAANFEATFTEISARTGVVGDELATLSEMAIDWGANTVFSGQQAADAFLQLLTTGMSVEDAITAMDSVLIGAAASGLDLGTTADRITNIMAGMRLEVDEGTYIIDRLARASGAVGGGMQPLMEAMEASAGTAQTFGIGLDELIPMLAIWSDAGIRGSEAGTQFRSMMIAMTQTTPKTKKAWDELGVSLYKADGTMHDMNYILQSMRMALADKSEEDKARILKQLAGSYGMAGLSALLASGTLNDMNTRIDESASASDIADANMGTFARTVESLMGSVEALMITALTPLMNDVLQPLTQDLIEIVNGVRTWAKENPELTNTIVGVLGGLLVLGPTLILTGMVFSGLSTGVGILASAFGLLMSPIGLATGAIVALIAGSQLLYPGGLGQMLVDASESAQILADAFMGFLVDAVNAVRDSITSVIEGVIAWTEENPELTRTLMAIAITLGVAGATAAGVQLTFMAFGAVMTAGSAILGFFTGSAGLLSGALGTLGGAFVALFSPVMLIAGGIAAVIAGTELLYPGGIVQMLLDASRSATILANAFIRFVSPAVTWIKARFDELLVTLAPVLETLQSIVDFANRGISSVSSIGNSISGIASSGASFGDIMSAAGNAISWQLSGGRADGGSVNAGEAYLVGERGMEVFMPNTSGTIIPNEALGGVQIGNITINANSAGEGREAMRGALDELMARQRARGGA